MAPFLKGGSTMKKLFLIAALIALLIVPYVGQAAELNNVTSKGVDGDLVFYDKDGNEIFSIEAANRKVTYPSGSAADIESGATFTIAGTFAHARERSFSLPLTGFVNAHDASPLVVTTTGLPGLQIDDSIPNIVWAKDEYASPVSITFKVPTDYSSGGAFRLICTESSSFTTPNRVDFDVYVYRIASGLLSTTANQTPVALTGTTEVPVLVTLTPGTNFNALAGGDWVTLRIWRDGTIDAQGDLEVKGVEFFYTAAN